MTRSLLALTALGALVVLPSCQLPKNQDQGAQFSKNLDQTLDAGGVRTLSLKTGPGTLTVIGEENRRPSLVGYSRAPSGPARSGSG